MGQHWEVWGLKCRPYGFLERFDPDFTPNTTDLSGRRYSYRSQTMIGHWNIAQLANAYIAGELLDQVTCLLPHVCFSDCISYWPAPVACPHTPAAYS